MTKFFANSVDVFENYFSDDFVVWNMFFEESDPEERGESWSFQRALGKDGTLESLGEEDEGVCTVKEIQQATFYECIESVVLTRNSFFCNFDEKGAKQCGTSSILATFALTDEQWEKMKFTAQLVFLDCEYFKIA